LAAALLWSAGTARASLLTQLTWLGEPDPYRTRFSLMAGLSQWMLFGGANVAAELKVGRFVFEYSHGQGLHLSGAGDFALDGAERAAGIDLRVHWTTGGGFGVSLLPNLHLLLEVKAHRYEVRGADGTQRFSYTTMSVGPGIFWEIYLWRGLFLQPSLRWWPTVASSLDEGRAVLRGANGAPYTHAAHSFGVFPNVSLGWTF
jgi:hypothetical protein